jgi:Fe-S-cluster containining protein
MQNLPLRALSQPRHACHACGNCCYGHKIRLVGPEEQARIEDCGQKLGVENPVEDGVLRAVDGHCVFLGKDRLCDIHRAFGGEVKPLVCQQYPIRVSVAEDGLRVGIDPGCTSVWRSWRDGPAIAVDTALAPHDIRMPEGADGAGEALLSMAQHPAMTVSRLLWIISGGQPPMRSAGDPLPPGFASRVLDRARALRLRRFIDDDSLGEGIRAPLLHVAEWVEALEDGATPVWLGQLAPELDAFVMECVRSSLFMRLGDDDMPTVGHVTLLLAGALVCGWADPTPERFGPAMSTWARASRYRAFWQGFFPRPETMQWLATGRA